MIRDKLLTGEGRLGVLTACVEKGLWYNTLDVLNFLGNPDVLFYSHRKEAPVRTQDFPMDKITLADKKTGRRGVVRWIKENDIRRVLSFEGTHFDVHAIRDLVDVYIDVVDWEMVYPSHFDRLALFDELWFPTELTAEPFRQYNSNVCILPDIWAHDVVERQKDYHGIVRLYHNAGTGGVHQRKNTGVVLDAFGKAFRGDTGVSLDITAQEDLHCFREAGYAGYSLSIGYMSRSDILRRYESAHVVVQPSKREGLGLPLYEAKKSGCVVITTNAPPMNEIGADNALFVDVDRNEPVKNSIIPLCCVDECDLVRKMVVAVDMVHRRYA